MCIVVCTVHSTRVFKNTEFYGGGKTSENSLNEPAEVISYIVYCWRFRASVPQPVQYYGAVLVSIFVAASLYNKLVILILYYEICIETILIVILM